MLGRPKFVPLHNHNPQHLENVGNREVIATDGTQQDDTELPETTAPERQDREGGLENIEEVLRYYLRSRGESLRDYHPRRGTERYGWTDRSCRDRE